MLLVLLAAQASAVDAERAFAKMAQEKGQWTAFRATAAPEGSVPEAIMFVPRRVNAQEWLKDKKDPANAVKWWPTAAWVSCNGYMTITTGGALWSDGSHGYFTTIWSISDPDRPKWRWVLDHGGSLSVPRPRPATPIVRKASCAPVQGHPAQPPLAVADAVESGGGASEKDLRYDYGVGSDGARELWVSFWNGKAFETVLQDVVPAPKP